MSKRKRASCSPWPKSGSRRWVKCMAQARKGGGRRHSKTRHKTARGHGRSRVCFKAHGKRVCFMAKR